MSEERRSVPLDEALRRIGDGEYAHTFLDGGLMLIGADWTRDQIAQQITEHGCEDSGPGATRMGHTLVSFMPGGRPVFIEAAPPEETAVR